MKGLYLFNDDGVLPDELQNLNQGLGFCDKDVVACILIYASEHEGDPLPGPWIDVAVGFNQFDLDLGPGDSLEGEASWPTEVVMAGTSREAVEIMRLILGNWDMGSNLKEKGILGWQEFLELYGFEKYTPQRWAALLEEL